MANRYHQHIKNKINLEKKKSQKEINRIFIAYNKLLFIIRYKWNILILSYYIN